MPKKYCAQILIEIDLLTHEREFAESDTEAHKDFLLGIYTGDVLMPDARILSSNTICKPEDEEFLACFGNKGEKYEPID